MQALKESSVPGSDASSTEQRLCRQGAAAVLRCKATFVDVYKRQGVACAILLPVGLEYNKSVAGERYRAVGKAMGCLLYTSRCV